MPNKIVDTYNHVFGKRGFDYNQINDDVFLGTNMCCQFGFKKELLDKGVRADISLEKERIDAPVGVDYFLWLPTEDNQAPDQDKLRLGARVLDFLIGRKIKVYIHCKNGHGRAPTLLAAYFIQKGLSVSESTALLQKKRPSIHLNDVQIAALRAFETSISVP